MRFTTGTIAEITELDTDEGFVMLVAEGGRRIAVDAWLEENPYPRADVTVLPDLEWDESLRPLRVRAEEVVRRVLALASEFGDQQWSAAVELSEEDVAAVWQLAAIAPLSPMDQVTLLAAVSTRVLLDSFIEFCVAAEETLHLRLTDN